MKTRIAMLVALAALLAPLASRAAAPPTVGPAVPVAAQPADARMQSLPACAADGAKTFLVAWQQGQKFFECEDPKVFAARVDAGGKVLDAKPIALSSAKRAQERPRVAFAGGVYLVVWQAFDPGTKTWDVYAARVKPDGSILDKEPVAVAAGAGNQAQPDVAGGPGGFCVVWQDDRAGNGPAIWAARVGADGRPSGAAALVGVIRGGTPWLVRTKSGWYVTWKSPHDPTHTTAAHLARIDDNMKVTALGRLDMIMTYYDGYLAGGETRLLYLNGSFMRGYHNARACFLDATTGKAIANPNAESKRAATGNRMTKSWKFQMLAHNAGQGAGGFLPPKSAGAIGDFFLVVVRAAATQKQFKTGPFPLKLTRIAKNGVRVDHLDNLTVLDDGAAAPVFNPAVAGLKDGVFLVTYESNGGPGAHRVLTRIVKTEMPESPSPIAGSGTTNTKAKKSSGGGKRSKRTPKE